MKVKVKSRLALAGGLLGLVGTAALGVLLAVNRSPGDGSWGLLSLVIYAAPYGIALGSAFVERATVRGPLLLASAVTSLFLAGFLSTWGLALLPAMVVLFIGTVRTLAGTGRMTPGGLARGLAALGGAAVLIIAVFALYTQDDERCWETIRYPDGSEETRSTERFGGGMVGPLGVTVQTSRGGGEAVAAGCTSDVVTAKEAAQGLLLTSAGVVFLLLLSIGRWGGSRTAPTVGGIGRTKGS